MDSLQFGCHLQNDRHHLLTLNTKLSNNAWEITLAVLGDSWNCLPDEVNVNLEKSVQKRRAVGGQAASIEIYCFVATCSSSGWRPCVSYSLSYKVNSQWMSLPFDEVSIGTMGWKQVLPHTVNCSAWARNLCPCEPWLDRCIAFYMGLPLEGVREAQRVQNTLDCWWKCITPTVAMLVSPPVSKPSSRWCLLTRLIWLAHRAGPFLWLTSSPTWNSLLFGLEGPTLSSSWKRCFRLFCCFRCLDTEAGSFFGVHLCLSV